MSGQRGLLWIPNVCSRLLDCHVLTCCVSSPVQCRGAPDRQLLCPAAQGHVEQGEKTEAEPAASEPEALSEADLVRRRALRFHTVDLSLRLCARCAR